MLKGDPVVADEQTDDLQQAILDLPISERQRRLLLAYWEWLHAQVGND